MKKVQFKLLVKNFVYFLNEKEIPIQNLIRYINDVPTCKSARLVGAHYVLEEKRDTVTVEDLFSLLATFKESFFMNAFIWGFTEEGIRYWSAISRDFKDYCYEKKIRI